MNGKSPNKRTSQQIDENLRRVFREKEEEAIPDRFADLLAQLKQQDQASGEGDGK